MPDNDDILKVLLNDAEDALKKSVIDKVDANPEFAAEFYRLKNEIALLATHRQFNQLYLQQKLRQFRQKTEVGTNTTPQYGLKQYIGYVAVVLVLVGIFGLLYYFVQPEEASTLVVTKVSTTNGQQSTLVLPDQSKVTLSYGSKVEYNNEFGISNRDLKFSGQALFEIFKNKKLPLRILTSDLNIEVKGTTFDVSAYQNDEEVTVKLFSGNIELFAPEISTRHNLKAGRMLVFDRKNKVFAPESTLFEKSLMWRKGIFIFDNNSMSEVLKKLERKYNLQIILTDSEILNSAFTATIKNEDFRDIFKQIEFACNVKCNIKLTPDSSTQATIYIRSR